MPKTPTKSKAKAAPKAAKTSAADRSYDAIVVGGGHNGLTNGAYLAKAGLKTLILERRSLFGGAAITEELYPGFWFTTFSYALSLLRPQIIHDLELTKHGFMPLLMSSTFAPMGKATVGEVGVTITSYFAKAAANSWLMTVRTFWAFR